MQISGWKKATLGIVGTILLGALGSGLWELALRPAGQWLGNGVLTAASLGSSALKDQVYIDAAKGYHEESANSSFVELTPLTLFFCTAAYLWVNSRIRGHAPEKQFDADGKPQAEVDAREKQIRVWKTEGHFLMNVLLLFGLLTFGDYAVQSLRDRAADDAYTFFAQSMIICKPYMHDDQAQTIESRFASIRGRADYINVTDDLRQIAASNHLRLPDFTPW